MRKGFTLIEMAIVLLVVGILAGIVIRNLGRQPAVARDTRRIADLRNTTNYLANYLGKFGHFPTSSSWSRLEQDLRNAGIVDRLPRDPSGGNYDYYYCSDTTTTPSASNPSDLNHFILRARLEQTPTTAPRFWEGSVTTTPEGWNCVSTFDRTTTCNQNDRYYCLAQ